MLKQKMLIVAAVVSGSLSALSFEQAVSSQSAAHMSTATSAAAQTEKGRAQLSNGTAFHAVLNNSLDAKKNKVGDKVTARVSQDVKSNGRVVIPKGSKVMGHITQVQARGKASQESMLGMSFDRAILKHGEEVPVNLTLQAIAAPVAQADSGMSDDLMTSDTGMVGMQGAAPMRSSGGMRSGAGGGGGLGLGSTLGAAGAATGSLNGVTSQAGAGVGSTVNGAVAARGASPGLGVGSALTSSSSGAIGLRGLSLNAAGSNRTQGSVISSSSSNVHLDSGTQLMLRVQN
jgi:hypothetical protein